ncbi:MAG: hypothetical protein HY985_00435 [Magnetospirillum sp.]|nr:hypothetical protein [Magnetospirillum sp.]
MDNLDNPTTARVVRGAFLHVESPADKFIERLANEKNPQSRLILATSALRHDPGCIEALCYLADHAKDSQYAVDLLRKAVDAGQQLWGAVAYEYGDEMTWWGFAATRPYMRAIQALGETHHEMGNDIAARECFERLLEMNPHDNQGIRFLLAGLEPPPSLAAGR